MDFITSWTREEITYYLNSFPQREPPAYGVRRFVNGNGAGYIYRSTLDHHGAFWDNSTNDDPNKEEAYFGTVEAAMVALSERESISIGEVRAGFGQPTPPETERGGEIQEIARWTGNIVSNHTNYRLLQYTQPEHTGFSVRKLKEPYDEYVYKLDGPVRWLASFRSLYPDQAGLFATVELAMVAFATLVGLDLSVVHAGFGQPASVEDTTHEMRELQRFMHDGEEFTLNHIREGDNYVVRRLVYFAYLKGRPDPNDIPTWWRTNEETLPIADCLYQTIEQAADAFSQRRGALTAEQAMTLFNQATTVAVDIETIIHEPDTEQKTFQPFNLEITSPEQAMLIFLLLDASREASSLRGNAIERVIETEFPGGTKNFTKSRRDATMSISDLTSCIRHEMGNRAFNILNKDEMIEKLCEGPLPITVLGCSSITYHPGHIVSEGSGVTVRLTTQQLELMAEACKGGYLVVDEHHITHQQLIVMAEETKRLQQAETEGGS